MSNKGSNSIENLIGKISNNLILKIKISIKKMKYINLI